MDQFAYICKPVRHEMLIDGPTQKESTILEEHFRYLETLVAKNVILMAGRTLNGDNRDFGIVVFLAASDQDAVKIMQSDPAVSRGVISAELSRYIVTLWSTKMHSNEETGA